MKDFIFTSYKRLINTFLDSGYSIQTYEDFVKNPKEKVVVLRHDVDRKSKNSLLTAKLEAELNVTASYYFRMVSESFNPQIINEIKAMGHEIGYHYENLSKKNGNYEEAIKDFEKNIGILNKFYPIKTMCMHGSPMSKWDNRNLWEKYDYHKYGIIAEPYFDLDFDEIFYLTDASRAWNNTNVSLRDKVKTVYNYKIKSINDILDLIENNKFPDKIMLNMHPHNWASNSLIWLKIYLWQGFKNIVKRNIKK